MACCYLEILGGMAMCKSVFLLLSSQHELLAYPWTTNNLWTLERVIWRQYQLRSSEPPQKRNRADVDISLRHWASQALSETIFSGVEIESIGSASRGTISYCAEQIRRGLGRVTVNSESKDPIQLATLQTSSSPIPRATEVILESSKAKRRSVQTNNLDTEESIQQTSARSRRPKTSSFWHSKAKFIPVTAESRGHQGLIFQLNSHFSKCKTLWQFGSIIYNHFPSETTLWSAITPVFQGRRTLARDRS